MKIEIQVKGKEVIIPEFKVFMKKNNFFIFGIKEKFNFTNSEEHVQGSVSKIYFKDNNLILELENKIFLFNISQYNLFKNKKEFDIAFVFLDESDKIITTNCKIFTTICR